MPTRAATIARPAPPIAVKPESKAKPEPKVKVKKGAN